MEPAAPYRFPLTIQDDFVAEVGLFMRSESSEKFKDPQFEMVKGGVRIKFSCEDKTPMSAFYFKNLVWDLELLSISLGFKLDRDTDVKAHVVTFIDKENPNRLVNKSAQVDVLPQMMEGLEIGPVRPPRIALPEAKVIFIQKYKMARKTGWEEVCRRIKEWEAFCRKYKDEESLLWMKMMEEKFKEGILKDIYRRLKFKQSNETLRDIFNQSMQANMSELMHEVSYASNHDSVKSVAEIINEFKKRARFINCGRLNDVPGFKEEMLATILFGIEYMGMCLTAETMHELEQSGFGYYA